MFNLANTFYDLFCHIYMSPNSHMKTFLTSVLECATTKWWSKYTTWNYSKSIWIINYKNSYDKSVLCLFYVPTYHETIVDFGKRKKHYVYVHVYVYQTLNIPTRQYVVNLTIIRLGSNFSCTILFQPTLITVCLYAQACKGIN